MANEKKDLVLAKYGEVYSITNLAREFGISRETGAALLSSVKPHSQIRSYDVYRLKDAVMPIARHLGTGAQSVNSDDFDPSTIESPKDRKDWYDSELKRVKHEEVTGKLIPAEIVANADAAKNKKIALMLGTLPDVLGRDAGLTGEQIEVMQRRIDAALNDLYQDLIEYS